MAYINVNLDAISSAKAAVEAYSVKRMLIIAQMNATVEGTASAWSAEDQQAFLQQWSGMNAADGAFTATRESLKSYVSILEDALTIYKNAQSESVEQAEKL